MRGDGRKIGPRPGRGAHVLGVGRRETAREEQSEEPGEEGEEDSPRCHGIFLWLREARLPRRRPPAATRRPMLATTSARISSNWRPATATLSRLSKSLAVG